MGDEALVKPLVLAQIGVLKIDESKAGVVFIALSDGSCFGTLQIVVPAECPDFDSVKKLTSG